VGGGAGVEAGGRRSGSGNMREEEQHWRNSPKTLKKAQTAKQYKIHYNALQQEQMSASVEVYNIFFTNDKFQDLQ